MEELRWTADDQLAAGLDRPILVVAFRGLFDAAGSATSAVEWLAERLDSVQVGDVDPETFFDFTQERPVVESDDHDVRWIRWATNRVLAVRTTEGQRDLVLVSGVEPHLRWRTFTEALLEAATRSGSRMVVTLGSMSGMSPHTRPPAVTGSSTNRDLADRLGLDRPSYQGPTGVVGVLHDTLDRAGVPVISLRVSVPYYLPDSPNPKATRALLRRFEQVSGIDTAHADLDGPRRVAVAGGPGGGRRRRGEGPRAPTGVPGRPERGPHAPGRRPGRRVGGLPPRTGWATGFLSRRPTPLAGDP